MIDENQTETATETVTEEAKPTDEVKLTKAEYEELLGHKTTVGSLKRQIKDLTKTKETTTETSPKPDALLEKTFLRSAGITSEDEIELALTTAKKWNLEIDKLVDDDDFKEKLEKHRTNKSNLDASSNVKGDKGGGTQAKNTSEYWIAKGVPPTADQVPDRKIRAKIAREMVANAKGSSNPFYNGK